MHGNVTTVPSQQFSHSSSQAQHVPPPHLPVTANRQSSTNPIAIVSPLSLQGVYRGLADTRTPFYATLASNGLNVVLGYGLIFTAGLGIR
jgi:hypothetical protein